MCPDNSKIMKKLLPVPTRICHCSLGNGCFQQISKMKKNILFTDHKPLEKMGHLHTKTMNRLKAGLLEHDFVV
jgi:hypothetical protein